MTEAEVQKLRDAGIGDDVILEMQKEEAGKKGQAAPTAEVASALPDIDPNTPSTVYQQAQAAGVPTEGREQTWTQTATELGGLAADNAGKIAGVVAGGGGLFAANQIRKGMQARAGAQTAQAAAQTAMAQAQMAQANAALQQAQGVQQRFDARTAARTPVTPATSPILDAQGRPIPAARPVVPTAPAGAVPTAPGPIAPVGAAPVAQAAETGVMNRAKQVVQQLALSKLAPMAANVLKGANVASLAGYSSDLGPKTPQSGRMKGMEINPLTNAPWTPEQIRQYEANPAVYDAQMAPPQFRR